MGAADWVVRDGRAPNYLASTLETISRDDRLNLIEPRIHLTTVKANQARDGPDLEYILTKVHPLPLPVVLSRTNDALLHRDLGMPRDSYTVIEVDAACVRARVRERV